MPYSFVRKTIGPLILKRITVEGLENLPQHGPYIVAGNHQSYTDAVQVAFPLIMRRNHKAWFLTTEHVWKTFSKLGGTGILTWLGMIPVLSGNKAESLAPAQQVLRSGGIIGIFPEGRRNKPSVNPDWERILLKGKTGAVRLALTTGTPIVPAGIIAPKGFTALQAIINFLRRSQPAIVRFGTPLQFSLTDPSTFTYEQLTHETRRVMQAISALCSKEYPY